MQCLPDKIHAYVFDNESLLCGLVATDPTKDYL